METYWVLPWENWGVTRHRVSREGVQRTHASTGNTHGQANSHTCTMMYPVVQLNSCILYKKLTTYVAVNASANKFVIYRKNIKRKVLIKASIMQ